MIDEIVEIFNLQSAIFKFGGRTENLTMKNGKGMKEIWKKSEKDTAGKLSVVSLQASWKKPY